MSWVQTAYLVAEVIAIPLTGVLTRALSMRWLFVLAIGEVHAGVVRLCDKREFRATGWLARGAGVLRRYA